MRYRFIFLFITTSFFAQTGFEQGNELYRKEQFQEAVKSYESVLQTNQESAELYFNIGNCYYKLNQVAPAIYNYEKALLLNPNDKEILTNLKFAQKLQIDEIKEVPKVGFSKLLHDFTSSFHFDTWAYVAVSLAFLFLLLFIGYYFSAVSTYKRIFFAGMFISLFLMCCCISSAMYEKSVDTNNRPAIVFAESVLVKSEPKTESETAFNLHEGTKVFVLETLDNWKKIELDDGASGWILSADIKEVK